MPSSVSDSVLDVSLPRTTLSTTAASLSNRCRGALVAAVLPVVLASIVIASYVSVGGPTADVSGSVAVTVYGVAALGVFGGVALVLNDRERQAALRFRLPSRAELLWTLVCLPVAIGAFLLGATVGDHFGYELRGVAYSLGNPVTLAGVVFGTLIVAPLVEEVLFRGLLLGSLLGRGVSPLVAGAVTVVLFASTHIVAFGVAGVLAIAGWAVFPTLLRLRFNNLTGAWLLHLLNNIYANIIVVWLGFA